MLTAFWLCRWDTYGRMIEPSSSTIAWMVIEGNHEREVVSGKEGFLAYNLRYHVPSTFSKSGTSLYYRSVDIVYSKCVFGARCLCHKQDIQNGELACVCCVLKS